MSRAATTLTKATLDRYGKAQTTLPEDLHYDADCLFKMFEKPKLMVRMRTVVAQSRVCIFEVLCC